MLDVPTDIEAVKLPESISIGDVDFGLPMAGVKQIQEIFGKKNQTEEGGTRLWCWRARSMGLRSEGIRMLRRRWSKGSSRRIRRSIGSKNGSRSLRYGGSCGDERVPVVWGLSKALNMSMVWWILGNRYIIYLLGTLGPYVWPPSPLSLLRGFTGHAQFISQMVGWPAWCLGILVSNFLSVLHQSTLIISRYCSIY